MAENFHLLGFVTVEVNYPPGQLSAISSKLVDCKLAEEKEGTMIFHQGWMGAYFKPVKGTITFKRDSKNKQEERFKHDDHRDFKVSAGANVRPKVEVEVKAGEGGAGAGAKLELGGVNADIGFGYDNKDYRRTIKDFRSDDKGDISVMGFEASIPELGSITCRSRWKKNELDLVKDESYDGDCHFKVSIKCQ